MCGTNATPYAKRDYEGPAALLKGNVSSSAWDSRHNQLSFSDQLYSPEKGTVSRTMPTRSDLRSPCVSAASTSTSGFW